ncbi:MAG: CopG family transcriptional regulator [Thermoguttaceae bacterium]|jgi:predicted transcriptional regulator
MKTVCLRLPEALADRLATMARKKGQSKSAVLRAILDTSLAEGQGAPEGSALEAAGDLAGCLEGPPDLSCNPRYLQGFGQ